MPQLEANHRDFCRGVLSRGNPSLAVVISQHLLRQWTHRTDRECSRSLPPNMAPPDNGNEYISFTQLIALENITASVFRSKALAFGPADGNRTYGGHVYMQACYAAAQTVPKGMMLHVSIIMSCCFFICFFMVHECSDTSSHGISVHP